MATDGPPESSVEALKYFRTLHRIGVRGSLGIAHVTKNGDGADQKPFGSAYWHNLARMRGQQSANRVKRMRRPCGWSIEKRI